MNVFIHAMVRIFSFGERWNVLFNLAIALLNRTFHLSPHENILTIALINIHYLYIIQHHTKKMQYLHDCPCWMLKLCSSMFPLSSLHVKM